MRRIRWAAGFLALALVGCASPVVVDAAGGLGTGSPSWAAGTPTGPSQSPMPASSTVVSFVPTSAGPTPSGSTTSVPLSAQPAGSAVGPATARSLAPGTRLTGHYRSTAVSGPGVVSGTQVEMFVDPGDVTLVVGCTQYRSNPVWSGATLRLPGVIATDYSCNGTQPQQEWLVRWVAHGLTVSGPVDTPTLSSDGDQVVLGRVDRTALDGALWVVDTVMSAGGGESRPGSTTEFMFFLGLGKVAVYEACNSGGTQVATSDSTLRFGPVTMSRLPCPHGPVNAPDVDLTTFLAAPVRYTIDGDRLTLTATDGSALICTARAPL